MVRMTHPDVVLPIDVPDDPGVIAVHEESGWVRADETPVERDPALAAEQVDVPPKAPKGKPKPAANAS